MVRYDGNPILKDVFIYIGLDKMKNENILPIDHYLDLCISGAKCYGDTFFKDFFLTTWTRNKLRLDK